MVVIVSGMPAVVCAKDHKRFLYPKFAGLLKDFVTDAEKIAPQPPAVRRGLFSKRYHCDECGAELPAVPTKKAEQALDAIFKDALPFKIIVETALYKCEGCGREQVLSNDEIAESASRAIAHALRAAEIQDR